MRIYISADIEGVCGIAAWDEARKSSPDHGEYRRQMNAEVAAACVGALAAGATAITVKDAHGSARNLIAAELPEPTQLIRGWSGHPMGMVQGLDGSYDAALFIGYHARAGAGGNPLAHTISSALLAEVRLNGVAASEYWIHALAAATVGVPIAFVSGDRTLCDEIAQRQPATKTHVAKWGEGPSQHSLHPTEAIAGIRNGVEAALRADFRAARLELPRHFTLELHYKDHARAYAKSFYPGAKLADPHTLSFETDDYFEVLRLFMFAL